MSGERYFLNGGACRAALHRELSVLEADFAGIGLQQMRGELGGFFFQLLERHVDGGSADSGAAAAESANAVLHDERVAVNHGDVINIYAKMIAGELCE